jgi:anti-sigma regulatory factor (Ser/Thr protein kinase)
MSTRHIALLYRSAAEYVAGVVPFLTDGIAADQPTFVAVPRPNLELIRRALNGNAAAVVFTDMTGVGRNPGRIIPAIQQFVDAHRSTQVRFVGEPIWPGRTAAEICEATRHEAMLNAAFAGVDVDILCPYDAARLEPDVVADAWRTHPLVVDGTSHHDSQQFTDPEQMYDGGDLLAPPPHDIRAIAIDADELSDVRQFVRRYAKAAGLGPRRTQDLVLAANEIATNTIIHTVGPGTLRLWQDSSAVVCEIADSGHIIDPFAGRRSPDVSNDHGRGLWMANQLCDLVQLRSTENGTTIRLQIAHHAA